MREVEIVTAQYLSLFQPDHVEPVIQSEGFSGAKIFKLRSSAGTFCLRRWPQHTLARDRILGLHRLLAEAHDAGVSQIAVPIVASNGQSLVSSGEYLWQMEPWMPGDADYHANPNELRLCAAMRCLASWHVAAARFRTQRAESQWFTNIESHPSQGIEQRLARIHQLKKERVGQLIEAIGTSSHPEFDLLANAVLNRFQQLSERVVDELTTAVSVRVPLQPCIRDVWHDHILFTANEVTGLIDLSACRTDNVATDLARLLGSMLADDKPSWNVALDAYQEIRPLNTDELRLLGAFDRSAVLLSGMTWLVRFYLTKSRLTNIDRIIERVEHYRSRLDHLAESTN